MSKTTKILFVCLGNICRSPCAEGIARHYVQQNNLSFEFDSAGTANYHTGNPPDHRMIELCAERHTPIDTLRARQIHTHDFESFDWIIAMDRQNFKEISKLCPPEHTAKLLLLREVAHEGARDVPDPYYGDRSDFVETYDVIHRALTKFFTDHKVNLH